MYLLLISSSMFGIITHNQHAITCQKHHNVPNDQPSVATAKQQVDTHLQIFIGSLTHHFIQLFREPVTS